MAEATAAGSREGAAVLVAQFFPPQNAVAAQRAVRLARALLDRYARVYVVCLDTRELSPSFVDFEIGRDVLEDPRLIRLVSSPVLKRYGYGARGGSIVQSVLGGIATRLLCGFGVDWIPAVGRSLRSISTTENVRVVIATGPPFIPFGVTAAWAARRSVPLILDYRDLWTANPHAPWARITRVLVNRLFERRVNRRAAALSTVSQGCKTMLQQDTAEVPVHVLYNAPDHEYLAYFGEVANDVAASRSAARDAGSQPLRIVFTGQVYQGCTFAPLLRAMATLPPDVSRRTELHYYGASSALAQREFAQFGLSPCLVDHGQVSKAQSVRAICGADLLLSLIHTDRIARNPAVAGHMSTKVYDYLLSGKPILNIGPVNAETTEFASRVGYGPFHPFTADDTSGLARFIAEAVNGAHLEALPPLTVTLPNFEASLHAVLDEVPGA